VLRQFICDRCARNNGCPSCDLHETVQVGVIRFLWSETVSGAYIYQRLCAHYGESVLSRSAFEWVQKFKEGRTSVSHEKGAERPSTSKMTILNVYVMGIETTDEEVKTTVHSQLSRRHFLMRRYESFSASGQTV
jgi:hypothetical protein